MSSSCWPARWRRTSTYDRLEFIHVQIEIESSKASGYDSWQRVWQDRRRSWCERGACPLRGICENSLDDDDVQATDPVDGLAVSSNGDKRVALWVMNPEAECFIRFSCLVTSTLVPSQTASCHGDPCICASCRSTSLTFPSIV